MFGITTYGRKSYLVPISKLSLKTLFLRSLDHSARTDPLDLRLHTWEGIVGKINTYLTLNEIYTSFALNVI